MHVAGGEVPSLYIVNVAEDAALEPPEEENDCLAPDAASSNGDGDVAVAASTGPGANAQECGNAPSNEQGSAEDVGGRKRGAEQTVTTIEAAISAVKKKLGTLQWRRVRAWQLDQASISS